MSNRFNPDTYPGARKGRGGRNKQGTARNHSQPLEDWKAIAEAERRDLARRGLLMPDPEPQPARKRKRRKTVKLWKDPAAVERGRKGAAARKANAPARAAKSEHERRSDAAKKGWRKIPQEERTERALRGWETRDMRYGRTRKSRQDQRLLQEQRRLERHKYFGHEPRRSGGIEIPF